jgi:tRNA A-37 threonylcarbamoyl transferase component Bud32
MRERVKSVDAFIEKYDSDPNAAGFREFSPIPVHYQGWRLRHEDLEEIKEIGIGASATVYYGTDKRTGKEVAIKKLRFSKLAGENLKTFQREVSVLATASHPCLLGFVGATDTPPFCIVTEWMAGGTLYQEIHKGNRLNPTKRSIAMFDIARGMQFLHSHHIVHRDLKSLNVLFDGNGYAHIADFGFARTVGDSQALTDNVGTPYWMAPEILAGAGNYSSKVDVYAFAVVLWEILTGQMPYAGLEPAQIVSQVLMHDTRPRIPDSATPQLRDLIVDCWAREPESRPTFDEIVHRFVRDRIALSGTDMAQYERHVQDTIGVSTDFLDEFETRIGDGSAVASLADMLEKDGLPEALMQRGWSIVERGTSAPAEVRARAAAFFLDTPMKTQAAGVLRRLPCGTVARKKISRAVELIPTGSEEFDKDLIITACKNGAADVAVVYAFFPTHLKLALEIVGQSGVRTRLRAAVADRCVQSFSSKDRATVCAAIRCLIGIGEIKRITGNVLKQQIEHPAQAVRNCGWLAATALALKGIEIDTDILETALLRQEDEILHSFLLAACHAPHAALFLVPRISFERLLDSEFSLRLLMVAARHEEVRPVVQVALKQLDFTSIRERWGKEIDDLAVLLGGGWKVRRGSRH